MWDDDDSCDGCGDTFRGATALVGRSVKRKGMLCPLCVQKVRAANATNKQLTAKRKREAAEVASREELKK